jgi:hypothetical protein
MNRSKKLQSELTTIKRQLHAARTQPPRENPVIRGFVKGLCGECPPVVNSTGANLTLAGQEIECPLMSRKHLYSYAQFSRAYQVSRQHVPNLVTLAGMPAVENPDTLFAALVESGRQSYLRTKLADPRERRRAAAALKTMSRMDELQAKVEALRATLPPRR